MHVVRIVPLSINEHACVLCFRTALKVRKMRVVCIFKKEEKVTSTERGGNVVVLSHPSESPAAPNANMEGWGGESELLKKPSCLACAWRGL